MKCKQCNKEITKKNQKVVSGIGRYKSKCKDCINLYHKAYAKRKAKLIKDASWF